MDEDSGKRLFTHLLLDFVFDSTMKRHGMLIAVCLFFIFYHVPPVLDLTVCTVALHVYAVLPQSL